MDDAIFTRQLCSWLDPFRLTSLSQQYMENPGHLERRVIATREANSFTRASDVGLDRLIRIFLENFDPSISAGTVVTFAGPALEILAVAGPLNFLIRLVDEIAGIWSPLPRDKTFYESSFHTELPTYLEACVASALGFTVDAAWTSGRQGENVRPLIGVVTMVGSPPFDRRKSAAGWAAALSRAVPPPRALALGSRRDHRRHSRAA